MATVTGWACGVCDIELAIMNSFHAEMKIRIAVVNTPGTASGRMTRRNAWIGRAPVDARSFLELPRHRPEEARQDVDAERQRETDVGDDHRLVGVDPAEVGEELEQGGENRGTREHGCRQEDPEHDCSSRGS